MRHNLPWVHHSQVFQEVHEVPEDPELQHHLAHQGIHVHPVRTQKTLNWLEKLKKGRNHHLMSKGACWVLCNPKMTNEALTCKLTRGPTAPEAPASPGTPCTKRKDPVIVLCLTTHIYTSVSLNFGWEFTHLSWYEKPKQFIFQVHPQSTVSQCNESHLSGLCCEEWGCYIWTAEGFLVPPQEKSKVLV